MYLFKWFDRTLFHKKKGFDSADSMIWNSLYTVSSNRNGLGSGQKESVKTYGSIYCAITKCCNISFGKLYAEVQEMHETQGMRISID